MNWTFFLSVLFKGMGAVLEILLQIFLIRQIGMEGYGTYITWINCSDLIFWTFFSSLIKGNTFYLSGERTSIKKYKQKYYINYVFPMLLLMAVGIIVVKTEYMYISVLLITLLELCVLDKSSTLIAKGKPIPSLLGEYVLGRSILLISVILLKLTSGLTMYKLISLYIIQYLAILMMFWSCTKKIPKENKDVSELVSIRKMGAYQRADIVQSMIGQMPVIIQFLFAGAYEAGVVSIVLLIKKFINFITGPTAKIFLPEFSRLYKENNISELCKKFAAIMRIQMMFVGPLAVALAGYPKVILRIWEENLIVYESLFVLCSFVFIVGATLGPCGGILQMSGNEKKDNFYREIALILMFFVMFVFRKDKLFVLYGLCVQTLVEAVGKYVCVCNFLGKAPVSRQEYMRWWIIPVVVIGLTYIFKVQESLGTMCVCAGGVFLLNLYKETRKENHKTFRSFLKK